MHEVEYAFPRTPSSFVASAHANCCVFVAMYGKPSLMLIARVPKDAFLKDTHTQRVYEHDRKCHNIQYCLNFIKSRYAIQFILTLNLP